jgi:hypothetical protein
MPEHNLIQAPELLRRLYQRLGLRQAHIAPTLAQDVQAVVLIDDLRDPGVSRLKHYGGAVQAVTDAVNRPGCVILNPTGSGVLARLIELQVNHNENEAVTQQPSVAAYLQAPVNNNGLITQVTAFFGLSLDAVSRPPASQAALGRDSAVALFGGTIGLPATGPIAGNRLSGSSGVAVYKFGSGVVMDQGSSVSVIGNSIAAGSFVSCTFLWTEEPAPA